MRSSSAWARSSTPRFSGPRSLYPHAVEKTPRKAPPATSIKCMTTNPTALVLPCPSLNAACPCANSGPEESAMAKCLDENGSDALEHVLLQIRPYALGNPALVCKAWRNIVRHLRTCTHSLSVHPLVVSIIMASAVDHPTLLVASEVCTTWCVAARAEIARWRSRVLVELRKLKNAQSGPPRALASGHEASLPAEIIPRMTRVPFVVRTMAIARLFGGDVFSLGGLTQTLRRSFRMLGVLHELSESDLDALMNATPELALVARPDPEEHGVAFAHEEQVFVTTGLERISPQVDRLSEVLAIGLMLVPIDELVDTNPEDDEPDGDTDDHGGNDTAQSGHGDDIHGHGDALNAEVDNILRLLPTKIN